MNIHVQFRFRSYLGVIPLENVNQFQCMYSYRCLTPLSAIYIYSYIMAVSFQFLRKQKFIDGPVKALYCGGDHHEFRIKIFAQCHPRNIEANLPFRCNGSVVELKRQIYYTVFYRLQVDGDDRSMGTIGRIAAFRLNFWGNTKISRSIPQVEDADDNLGKYCHMERVIFFCTSVSICPITMFFGKYL